MRLPGLLVLLLAFVFAPIGGCLGALAGAIIAAIVTSRRERARDGVMVSPRPPMGRFVRIGLGVVAGFVVGYGAAIGILSIIYSVQGPSFASYGWAFAAVWTPKVLALAGATLGGLIANPNS